jgi:hypothetical protein
MKGILASLVSGDKTEVELDYEIVTVDGRKVFKVIGGPTGYESFYVDDAKKFKMSENGWNACMGTKYGYDRLFIPGDEMKKALEMGIKTEEVYQMYVDGDWVEDVETKEEVKERIEYWIYHNDYLEDELLDTRFEAVVSSITIQLMVREVEK